MPAWQLFLATLITALGLSVLYIHDRDEDAHVEQFGASLAAALASQAIEPFLAGDLIHLGVLANRVTALPEVIGTTIYTVEDRLLSSSGDVRRGRPFTQPLTHEGRIVGYVRLNVDEARFGLAAPTGTLLLAMLWAALVPMALLVGQALPVRVATSRAVAAWRGAPPPAELQAPDVIVAPEPEPRFLIVVNLFNQLSLGPERRAAELTFARRLADTVAELYNGRVSDLPGTGLLLRFAGNGSDDRPFHVICAAFVLAELLRSAESWGHYRIGAHMTLLDPAVEPQPGDDPVTDTAVLSALARDGTLVLSAALLGAVRYPQRVAGEPLTHPLLEELETIDGGAFLARRLAEPHADLIAQQVAELGYSERSTARESTF